jgi:hypothetical protein
MLGIISSEVIASWDLQYVGYCRRNYGITTRLNTYWILIAVLVKQKEVFFNVVKGSSDLIFICYISNSDGVAVPSRASECLMEMRCRELNG